MVGPIIAGVIALLIYCIPVATIVMLIRAQERAEQQSEDEAVPTVPASELWLKAVLWPITLVQVMMAIRRGSFPPPKRSPDGAEEDGDSF